MLQAKCIIMIGSPSKAVLNSQDTTSRVRRTRTHADAQLHNWHCSFKLFLEMARGQISRCFGGAKRAVCFFRRISVWREWWSYKHMCNLYESIFDTFETRTLKVMREFGVFGCIWYILLQAIFVAILAAAAGDSWRCCAFLAFIALPSKSSWTVLASSLAVLVNSLIFFPPAQTQCVRISIEK